MRINIYPKKIWVLLLLLAPFHSYAFQFKTITLKAADGLDVTADLYDTGNGVAPFIILFHQAGWSRGEYREIAPRLNTLGFNCMAVDQRSGGEVNEVSNQTSLNAKAQKKLTGMIDAIPDIEGAIKYVKDNYGSSKIIIWGSSYSASLVLKIAGDHPDLVDGILSFSPGEYFGEEKIIAGSAQNIKVPVFITSAKGETGRWADIFAAIPAQNKVGYKPEASGKHGSRTLWKSSPDSELFWKQVTSFLDQFKR